MFSEWFVKDHVFRKLLFGATFGFPLVTTFYDFVGTIVQVEGLSMQPTFNPRPDQNDLIYISKWNKYNVNRGDIVVLTSPKDPRIKLIKRVIGLEGDNITTLGYKESVVSIPQGHIWVEGDRTDRTMDSNFFGPVPLGLVVAKATWILWPPNRIQSLNKAFVRLK